MRDLTKQQLRKLLPSESADYHIDGRKDFKYAVRFAALCFVLAVLNAAFGNVVSALLQELLAVAATLIASSLYGPTDTRHREL